MQLNAIKGTRRRWSLALFALAALTLLIPIAPARAATPDTQLAELIPSDLAADVEYGVSVGIDGNTAVSAAWGADDWAGAAYVFVQNAGAWGQQAKLTASDGSANDSLGASVAISGDTVVAGAVAYNGYTGAAYVWVRAGISWSEQAKLTASDGGFADQFGVSIAIDRDTIVVGARYNDEAANTSGAAYVFVRTGGTWSFQQKLIAGDAAASDSFGFSVGISGDTIVVGSLLDDDDGSNSGSAYVFTRTSTTWAQQQKLTASDAAGSDLFGISVAIDGESVVVGASGDDDGGSSSGSTYVFVRSGGTWSEQQKLTANDAAASDEFGRPVSISGDSIIAGAKNNDDAGSNSGSAYVFSRNAGTWTQQDKLTASDAVAGDIFGVSVAISGETAAIGAQAADSWTGSAYVFGPPAPPSTDLSIAKSANASSVDPGSNVTYTITVTNNGPATAASVTVIDTLPTGAAFVSSGAGCGNATSGVVICTTASIAIGANVQFTITVAATATPGPMSNTASVAVAAAADLADGDNSTTLFTSVVGADLAITKSASPAEARVGQSLTYTLTVTNNGPDTATSISVVDTLPSGLTADSVTGACAGTTTVTCTAESLANGANVVFTITVTAPNTTGSISNSASVSAASPPDTTSSNDSVTLVTSVLGFPPVPAIGARGLGALALTFGAFVFFARRRRVNTAR